MKRVVMAALVAAGAGLIGFNAPADAATNHAGTMVGTAPNNYAYGEGVCGTPAGDGDFSIVVGDSIAWTNCSTAPHTVTGNSFGSTEQISPGSSSPTYTFTTPGTFAYHCELHPSMTGKVTVTGEPPPATTTTQTTQTTVATPTTRRATTTTTSTSTPAATDNTADLGGVFGEESTTSSPSTTIGDATVTTRALGEGGDTDTSVGMVAALIVGLGAVGTAAALLIRRLRGGPEGPL